LERTRENLVKFNKDIETTKDCIPAITEKAEIKEDNYKRLKAELRELENLDRYEAEITQLKVKLLWVEVYTTDADIDKLTDTLNGKKELLQEAHSALEEAQTGLSSIGNIDESREIVDAMKNRIVEATEVGNHKRQQVTDITKTVSNYNLALRKLQESAQEYSRRKDNCIQQVC
jgi:chromosome segregation ATPase